MSADIFVYLDTVQFSKNGLQNRNQIMTGSTAHWLTVPVKHRLGQTLRETEIADQKATTKHWKTLQANYSHSSGLRRWRQELGSLLESNHSSLAELAIASTEWMLEKLAIQTKRVRASELPESSERASKLVASICRQFDADTYLTGTGALEYLDPLDFAEIGCEVLVQVWEGLTYPQQHRAGGFVPDLSTLDLLLNCPDEAAEMIRSAGSWNRLG